MRKIVALMAFVMVAICCQGQRFVKIGVTTNELVTMNPFDLNNVVVVKGYGATNTSDGALFQFILGDTRAANGVDVFAPSNNAGRWIMVRTASRQFGNQFMGGGTNAITLTNNLALTSLVVSSNSYITNLSVFVSYTNSTATTFIQTTNYTLISTNVNFYSTNITILTNTYISFPGTNYVINLFPGGGTNSVATEGFVTNTILTYVVGTNLYYVFDTSQFTVAGGTNISILDGATLTNVTMRGMTVDDMLINGDWAIMTNGVNDIQWHRDALITSYPELTRQYSFDQLTLSNRRPYSVMNQADFTNIVDKMFDRTQFDIKAGWTNDATLVTPWTNWMIAIKPGVTLTNAQVYGSLDFQDTVVYFNGISVMQVNESDFFITDGVSKNWNFKTTADANTVARISDLTSSGYSRMMEEGVNLTQRTNVNFTGLGLTVSDDAGNARTRVTVHTNLDLFVGLSSATNGFVMFNGVTPSATLRQIQAGGGITVSDGGGASGNPIVSQSASSTIQLVQVDKNSAGVVGTRSQLNFIEGGGIALTITDDAGSGEVDIQIDNTGNLYNFNTNQFVAGSVTNISIKSGTLITNPVIYATAVNNSINIRGVSGAGAGQLDLKIAADNNVGLFSTNSRALTFGFDNGADLGLSIYDDGNIVGAAEIVEIGKDNVPTLSISGGYLGWGTMTVTGSLGGFRSDGTYFISSDGSDRTMTLINVTNSYEGVVAVVKTDSASNPITITNASGNLLRAPGNKMVLTNQYQSAIFQADANTNWHVLAAYNPDNATTVQVTNTVNALVPTLVVDNTTKRVQSIMVRGSTTTFDSFGDVLNTIGAAVAVPATSTTGYMNNYPTAASAFDPDGVFGLTICNIAHDPHLTAFVRCPNNTAVTYWVGFGFGSVAQIATNALPSATVSSDYAAFRFCTIAGDATWQAGSGNGTTDGFTDTGVAVDTSNTIKLEVISSANGTSWEYKINGASVATRTTLLPVNTHNLFPFITVSSTAAAAAKSISFSRYVVSLDE